MYAYDPISSGYREQCTAFMCCGERRLQKLRTTLMTDFIYLAVIALFFVGGELYALWCGKL